MFFFVFFSPVFVCFFIVFFSSNTASFNVLLSYLGCIMNPFFKVTKTRNLECTTDNPFAIELAQKIGGLLE